MSEPYTTVRWRKDGKILRTGSDNGNQRIKNYKTNGTLLIQQTKISDRGEYMCEVYTQGFEPILSKPATISVIGECFYFFSYPFYKYIFFYRNFKVFSISRK